MVPLSLSRGIELSRPKARDAGASALTMSAKMPDGTAVRGSEDQYLGPSSVGSRVQLVVHCYKNDGKLSLSVELLISRLHFPFARSSTR
jgi:hypothetical protein